MTNSLPSLREHVGNAHPAQPPLPLVHTTDGYAFRGILIKDSLEPVLCPVFEEPLLYFFYGCPAYKPHSNSLPTSVPGYSPICLVLAPTCAFSIKRIYPFDSGAFKKGMYEKHLYSHMSLANFELEPSPETPARVVSAFYSSNENYYEGQAVMDKASRPLEFEVQCYHNMITDKGTTGFDVRRGTIEIQASATVPLRGGTVLAVALPRTFLDDALVQEKLKAWNAEPLDYKVNHARPSDFVRDIFISVREYLRKNEYL